MGNFKLKSKTYDFFKKLVEIVLPASASLYFGLSVIWGFPGGEKVVGSLALVTTFLGVVIGISKSNYEASGDKFDGSLLINQDPENGLSFNMDVRDAGDDILEKDEIVLRAVHSYLPQAPPEFPTDLGIPTNPNE